MKVIIEYDDPNLNTIHRLHSATPFREFDIITTDGRKYHVEKSYECAYNDDMVYVANEEKSGIYRLQVKTIQNIEEQRHATRRHEWE